MNWHGWAEIIFTLTLTLALSFPLGAYLARVWNGKRTWLHPLLRPLERGIYRLAGIDTAQSQNWLGYGMALLAFSAASFASLYAILRLQAYLPLNPQGFPGLSPHLAFDTAISFVTNTNWQSYAPESAVSTFTQMAGFTTHNFLSAAAGIAVAAAVTRAFLADRDGALGNFWVDLTRISLYVLLPFSFIIALVFVVLGEPQSLAAHVIVKTLEGARQTIAMFPVASQEAIKQLGTNGGGIFNANSAHPFENPSAITNLIEMVEMNVLGFACVVAFGLTLARRRDARVLLGVMALFVIGAAATIYWADTRPVPALLAAHADASLNMEGKEVRFGIPATAIWTAETTGASDGGVNGMIDSMMPLAGGAAMFMIQLGEVLPGGVGSGLYGMIVLALLSVFVAGLMVGRTPEYLGKKVEAREIRYAMLAVLILPLAILGFSAVACVLPAALSSLANPGPHGLSEILYAYSSAAGNNGSAFAGLNANTPWWNTTLGIAMLLGRFGYAIPVLAIAGSLAAKPRLAPSPGTLPTNGLLFAGLLAGIILILGGLQFFPALALGPILEHFQLLQAVQALGH